MMQRIYSSVLFIVLLIVAGATPAHAAEKIRLQLKWKHQFQFAGYYAAEHLGYYRDAGLDVEIRPAGPGIDATETVLHGEAEYGVGNSGILLSRNGDKPLVVLAVIMQHSPFVLLTHQKATINGIQDLAGKRLMIEPLADEIVAFLNHEGMPLSRFSQVLENPYSLDSFITGEVDAIDGYTTDETYQLMRRGIAFNVYHPRSAGIDFYGDNLFTTEEELTNHPERVRRFREASLRGWRYAMDHQQEIIELILANYPTDKDRDFLTFEALQMEQLIHPELIDIGYMHDKRWRRIAETYASLNMLPEDVSLEGFMYEEKRPQDLFWFYITTAGTLLILGIALLISLRFSKMNQQLAHLLHVKSQFANIGESVNNISHQWKQPLNELAIQLMLLEQLSSDNSLPEPARNKISEATRKSHALLEFMAKTVNTFGHVLRTGSTATEFSPRNVIKEVIYLVKDTFQLNKISVNYTFMENTRISGNSTEFAHVILSILNNARDTIIERLVDPAFIQITTYHKSGYLYLVISDNAGGVKAQPIDRIFTLGFSDKASNNSGVGLYIARKIITEGFKGTIDASNSNGGAVFTIAIPCHDEMAVSTS